MSKGLSNKLAGQVGEFLVCAELGRRGLIATPFSGNVPEYDLIVADESLKTLPVQVKTSRSHSWPTRADHWINVTLIEKKKKQIDNGNREISHPELIYVCVALAPPGSDAQDRYFILLKKDLQLICATNYRAWMQKHNWSRPKNFRSLDNRYCISNLEDFEDNWGLFEKQLAAANNKD